MTHAGQPPALALIPRAGYKHGGFGAPELPARSKKEQGRMT
jgi:hypothetical protein